MYRGLDRADKRNVTVEAQNVDGNPAKGELVERIEKPAREIVLYEDRHGTPVTLKDYWGDVIDSEEFGKVISLNGGEYTYPESLVEVVP